jgi:hypothetical protein
MQRGLDPVRDAAKIAQITTFSRAVPSARCASALAEVMRQKCNLDQSSQNLKKALCSLESYGDCITKMLLRCTCLSLRCLQLAKYKRLGLFRRSPLREHAINNYYLRQFACIRNWCQRMRHILSTKQSRRSAEGTSRVFTRTKRNFSAETLANRAAKKDQSMFLKRAFIYLLFHCSRHFCG